MRYTDSLPDVCSLIHCPSFDFCQTQVDLGLAPRDKDGNIMGCGSYDGKSDIVIPKFKILSPSDLLNKKVTNTKFQRSNK